LPEFLVVLTNAATADLDALALRERLQVAEDIASLARDPLPPRSSVKELTGYRPPLYRLRAGDYRVLYRLTGRTVAVIRVVPRRELDRALGSMSLRCALSG
jgi:mRNA-degrading endonuclease RelE of RelBE toxin-antitoxin system